MQNSLTAIERSAVLNALRRVPPTGLSATCQPCRALALIAEAIDGSATRDELLAIHANLVRGITTGSEANADLGRIVRAVMVRHAGGDSNLACAA